MTQMLNKPTQITKSSQTLLDLIFTNKPERVTKTYNLITGMSDHNLTLLARKLTKARYKSEAQIKSKMCVTFIPKKDLN